MTRNSSRSRPDSSPPALGPRVRASLLIGGAILGVLSGAGLLLMVVTTPQALAFGIVGASLGAFGIGTGHEVEFPTAWRGLRASAQDVRLGAHA